MAYHTRVTCDMCHKDLSDVLKGPNGYGLHLTNIRVTYDPVLTLLHTPPPIDPTVDFCGFACLKKWLEDK